MSDIFREVEEDIRREQLRRLWDRFGVYVLLVAFVIVAATAGWRGWLWYSERQAAAAGERYYQALDLAQAGSRDRAAGELERIAAEGGPFAGLARLRAAAELAATGDRDGAAAAYDAMAGDRSMDGLMRDLARIRAGYLMVDTVSRAQIEERIGSLAGEGAPWRHSAREILGLAAYRDGDHAGATEWFDRILGDRETPAGMRARAELMLNLMASDGAAPEVGVLEQGNTVQ